MAGWWSWLTWAAIIMGVMMATDIIWTGGGAIAIVPAFIAGALYGQWDCDRIFRKVWKAK